VIDKGKELMVEISLVFKMNNKLKDMEDLAIGDIAFAILMLFLKYMTKNLILSRYTSYIFTLLATLGFIIGGIKLAYVYYKVYKNNKEENRDE